MASSLRSRTSSTEFDSEAHVGAMRPMGAHHRLSLPFRRMCQVTTASRITHVDIFVGSLTGTSEKLAAALADKAGQRGVVVALQSLEDFDPALFTDEEGSHHSPTRLTVFVVSTHFAGGPSPNAEAFSQWLRLASGNSLTPTIDPELQLTLPEQSEVEQNETTAANLGDVSVPDSSRPTTPSPRKNRVRPSAYEATPTRPSSAAFKLRSGLLNIGWRLPFSGKKSKPRSPFQGVQYAVFGVGNSMYLTYNAMGKFVDARLQALGAVRMAPLGLGDVSDNIDAAFAKWEANLLQLLVMKPHEPEENPSVQTNPMPPKEAGMQRLAAQANLRGPPLAAVLVPHSPPNADHGQTAPRRRYSSATTMILKRRTAEPPNPAACTSATTGGSVKFTVLDKYGRPVRLRFRCRYIDQERSREIRAASFTLPPLNPSGAQPVVAPIAPSAQMTSRTKSLRVGGAPGRDATHIRRPCIAVKSIRMLKRSLDSTVCDRRGSVSQFKEIALVRMAIQDPEMRFQTADTFGYFPPNPREIVEAIGQRLELDMDACVEFFFQGETPSPTGTSTTPTQPSAPPSDGSRDHHLPFPSPCSVRTVLSDFLELRTVSREFVRVASGFVTDAKEHELLENLVSIDASAAFNREFALADSGVLKMLELAPSLRIPIEVLVNITPLLKPRLYSVASSHRKHAREFDVVVALGNPSDKHGLSVANFRNLLARSEAGLPLVDAVRSDAGCTSTLPPTGLPSTPGMAMPLLRGFISSSLFKTPSDPAAPMIMIANGIGIGPLRALLQHREIEEEDWDGLKMGEQSLAEPVGEANSPAARAQTASCPKRGKNLLLLGCSNKSSLLFEAELREWERKGFVEFHVAFSSEIGQPTQHVQDLVAAQNKEIATLMTSNPEARVYICGKMAMARSVHRLLTAPESGVSSPADHWYARASQTGRYIQGIFG